MRFFLTNERKVSFGIDIGNGQTEGSKINCLHSVIL